VPLYLAARRVPSNDAKMSLFSVLPAQSAAVAVFGIRSARNTRSDCGNYLTWIQMRPLKTQFNWDTLMPYLIWESLRLTNNLSSCTPKYSPRQSCENIGTGERYSYTSWARTCCCIPHPWRRRRSFGHRVHTICRPYEKTGRPVRRDVCGFRVASLSNSFASLFPSLPRSCHLRRR